MKRYLLTWYGMTDLRASLNADSLSGPVLSAICEGDYTDVVVLAYTRPDNTEVTDDSVLAKFTSSDAKSPQAVSEFIDRHSNTSAAHRHFINWISNRLAAEDKRSNVILRPVSLRKLNDTEGIYDAATQTLESIAKEDGEKQVTLYLSPGTPVMAFVWAFAALNFPSLKKRLIASSQPGKPPENIVLPAEWLEWYGRKIPQLKRATNQYDVIFHLFGEQRMPSLLGINQFESNVHIFITSEQFSSDSMKQFIGDADYFEVVINPYDPEDVRKKIVDLLEKLPPTINIAFNLTGGTKLMYAGALSACRKHNGTPFYFENKSNRVINLNNFESTIIEPITSVETFINLNGDDLWISNPGYFKNPTDTQPEDRDTLTKEIWLARSSISSLYKKIIPYNDSNEPFEATNGKISIQFNSDESAYIHINGNEYTFSKWPNFARYITGGWFEEYTYKQLLPLLEENKIFDLRIGLEVSIDDASGYDYLTNQQHYQELDVVFTDGKSLYIIECKAGTVKSDHIMKLQNIVRHFGGVHGKGILNSCFKIQNKTLNKKIQDSKNIKISMGDSISNTVLSLLD